MLLVEERATVLVVERAGAVMLPEKRKEATVLPKERVGTALLLEEKIVMLLVEETAMVLLEDGVMPVAQLVGSTGRECERCEKKKQAFMKQKSLAVPV